MNIDLEARRQKAQEQFDVLLEQKTQKEKEISEIDTELVRLQGEYRAYDNLAKTKNVSKEANKIDIKEPENASANQG